MKYGREFLSQFDFSGSILFETYESSYRLHRTGEYAAVFREDGALVWFSYGTLQGRFSVEIDEKQESGNVCFDTEDASYRDGKLFYSPSGFREDDAPSVSIPFSEWVQKTFEYVYARGQGNTRLNYLRMVGYLRA